MRFAEETLITILGRAMPTFLPDNNQSCIGQRDRLCLQIVWHSYRRRKDGEVLCYFVLLHTGKPELKQHWKTSDYYNIAYRRDPSRRNITTEAKDAQQM